MQYTQLECVFMCVDRSSAGINGEMHQDMVGTGGYLLYQETYYWGAHVGVIVSVHCCCSHLHLRDSDHSFSYHGLILGLHACDTVKHQQYNAVINTWTHLSCQVTDT